MSLPHFNIFYSWQSYVGGHANRSYIRQKINKFIESNKGKYEIKVDEDSRDIPGSSDIPENILKKIAECDIFVCDITPVTRITTQDDSIRDIPNPNVMFELGFAVSHIGWERIILVLNTHYGSNDYVPFDISKHKILCYKKEDGNGKSENSLDFTISLNSIIDNYSNIIKNARDFDYIRHDTMIFNKLMSFRSEREFINSIKNFEGSYRYSKWDRNGWNHFQYFHEYAENKFINSELNEKFTDLSKSIEQLHSDTAGLIFTTNDRNWEYEQPDKVYSEIELEQIQQTQLYALRKLPYPVSDSDKDVTAYYEKSEVEEKTIKKSCKNVIEKYHDFRIAIKKTLVI